MSRYAANYELIDRRWNGRPMATVDDDCIREAARTIPIAAYLEEIVKRKKPKKPAKPKPKKKPVKFTRGDPGGGVNGRQL